MAKVPANDKKVVHLDAERFRHVDHRRVEARRPHSTAPRPAPLGRERKCGITPERRRSKKRQTSTGRSSLLTLRWREVDSNHRSPPEIVVDSSGSRRDHRAKYGCLSARPRVRCFCPPGKTQHLLPKSVFDRSGSDRWNLASTTFPDAGPMVRIHHPPAESPVRT